MPRSTRSLISSLLSPTTLGLKTKWQSKSHIVIRLLKLQASSGLSKQIRYVIFIVSYLAAYMHKYNSQLLCSSTPHSTRCSKSHCKPIRLFSYPCPSSQELGSSQRSSSSSICWRSILTYISPLLVFVTLSANVLHPHLLGPQCWWSQSHVWCVAGQQHQHLFCCYRALDWRTPSQGMVHWASTSGVCSNEYSTQWGAPWSSAV